MKFSFNKRPEEEVMITVTFYESLEKVEHFKKELIAVSQGYQVRPGDIVRRDDSYVLEIWVPESNPGQAVWMLRKAGIKNYNHLRV